MDDAELLDRARDGRANAHCPYSEFPVGAAVLTADGSVYTAGNVGIANYEDSLCAERVALFAAVADGHRAFEAIAVVAGDDLVTPCGSCRQALVEFCDPEFRVVCGREDGADHETYALGDLLPAAFRLDTE